MLSELMRFFSVTMSALLLTILGLSSGIQHCPMWKEIAPCKCRIDSSKLITLTCEKMGSFDSMVELLRGHFFPSDRASLRIAYSNLNDLQSRSFKELNMSIENLKLNHDYIAEPLNENTFDGLTKVNYFSLADNNVGEIPDYIWKKVPNVKTLDLGRTNIKYVDENSFASLPELECLVLPGNQISRIDTNAIPAQVERLHLGRNHLRDLNNTLRNLSRLGWLFINTNQLTTLDDQLPIEAPNLMLIHASQNMIERLPQQLRNVPNLESLFLQQNRLKSLDEALSRSRKLMRIVLDHNQISTISENDFAECDMLESILLGYNEISSLNNSLVNLRNLNCLNLTFNLMTEFSFQDIVGLPELASVDLSHNQISTLIGPAALFQNLIEWNTKLTELRLDHNHLETLNGALSGLPELLRLYLNNNRLKRISPDDLIGLEQLRLLDVSYNHLTTLEETSKTFLPKLSELLASHNYLTILERDFHGLPVLCHADLSDNQIVALGRDLVSKTRCKIEHGVHEGTWDTLKIDLNNNPILCDAALPEITSAMEINHTRISGVSHCPPLSEQPVTTKPNAFLGYVPDDLPSSPAAIAANPAVSHVQIQTIPQTLNPGELNNIRAQYGEAGVGLRSNDQYTIENDQPVKTVQYTSTQNPNDLRQTGLGDQATSVDGLLQQSQPKVSGLIKNGSLIKATDPIDTKAPVFDPVQQGQQITKLASQIEELRSRIDELSNQNQLLLHQQFNKSISNEPTTKPPNEDLTELRKP